MHTLILLVLCAVAASAAPQQESNNRIIGGSTTPISNYPTIAALLYSLNLVDFYQSCGGTILNQRAILSAAHCFLPGGMETARWRIRVGSAYASSGGILHSVSQIINHPNFNTHTLDSDLSILRTAATIVYVNNAIQPAVLGGYTIGDNQSVWAAGWGLTETDTRSEELRHVNVMTINQEVCRQRYGSMLTDNMLCAGILDVANRSQCSSDSGGPLYHNGNVVGVCSFGSAVCGSPSHPPVNVRVSSFISWIRSVAEEN